MNPGEQENKGHKRALIFVFLSLYPIAVAIGYLSDPLAMAPQLDAAENLQLAAQIAEGNLAVEPFYRAMLYPALLSLVPFPAFWPQFAVIIGLLMHLGSSFLVRSIAEQVWRSPVAGKGAFVLYLLNPVILFFSLQAMDMALAILLFLGSIRLVLAEKMDPWWKPLATGLLAGAACLARPHFLPVAGLLVLIPLIHNRSWGTRFAASGFLLTGLVLLLGLQGLVNLAHAGQFRILPWQGAYNLYAANREGANGLYYQQTIDLSGRSFMNPARLESELLYQSATGEAPPHSIEAMNEFWRAKTREFVFEEPGRLLKLIALKAYAVANSHEQYNNLTFSFHKERLLLLRYNPLGWGLLLILAVGSIPLLWQRDRKAVMVILLLVCGYSVSLLLYYASARFRLPLVPLLTVLAAGVFTCRKRADLSGPVLVASLLLALLSGLITFSSFGSIRDRDTYVQDRLLMANANADVGNDAQAARWALEVLEDHPHRREAQRIYTISYFNLRLIQSPEAPAFGSWEEQTRLISQTPATDPVQDVILGVYFWQWGERDRATAIWQTAATGGPASDLARACLEATGLSREAPLESSPLKLALEQLLD